MLAYFSPGWPEIVIVCFIVLLLFGKRLPGVMRSMGQSIVEFKKGAREIEDEEGDVDHQSDQSAST